MYSKGGTHINIVQKPSKNCKATKYQTVYAKITRVNMCVQFNQYIKEF